MMEGIHEAMFANTTTKMNIIQLNRIEFTKYLPVTIILVIIMCVGIVGNTLVVYIYKYKFKHSSARVYILSLATADLTVCVFGIPYHVLDLTLILTYSNKHLCKVFSYFIGACTFSSMFILMVVGLDRYFKVCRPLKRQIVDFGDRKACFLAVIVAVVISIPNGIIYGNSSVKTGVNNVTGTECFIDDTYQESSLVFGYMIFNMLVFLSSVMLLIIMYSFICLKIYKHDKGEITLSNRSKSCCEYYCCYNDPSSRSDQDDVEQMEQVNLKTLNNSGEEEEKSIHPQQYTTSRVSKEKFVRRQTLLKHTKHGMKVEEKNTRKITLMMMTITMVFILAYLPFIIISILDNLDETFWDGLTESKALILDLLLRIYLINNAANPVIYSFWDFRFRKETTILLRTIFCCWSYSKENGKNDGRDTIHIYSSSTKITEGHSP